jgi:hypothetical protein
MTASHLIQTIQNRSAATSNATQARYNRAPLNQQEKGGQSMDEFQLLLDGVAVGPIRRSWEEAAEDAVLAGLAEWVDHDFPNSRAITWSRAGRASIGHLQSRRLAVVED